jgi:hypothetical protein
MQIAWQPSVQRCHKTCVLEKIERSLAMLEISPAKVAHIIIKAREYDAKVGAWDENRAAGDSEEEPQSILEEFGADATRAELAEFIAGLNEDEQANLVALTWVGRGTYSAEEFDEAVEMAKAERINATEDYLLGTPLLGGLPRRGAQKNSHIRNFRRGGDTRE